MRIIGQHRQHGIKQAATVPSKPDMVDHMIGLLDRIGVDYHHYDLSAAADAVAKRVQYLVTRPSDPQDHDPNEKYELDDSDYFEEIDIAARTDRAPWLYERGLY